MAGTYNWFYHIEKSIQTLIYILIANLIMIKRLGIIFSGLLILLLLSNINYNANVQVLAQQNASVSTTNTSVPIVSSDAVSNTTKLTGGVKIMSPDKGDLVPLNSNKSLVIQGISKDNATSDCDVSVVINNVKPYQNVQPTGAQGANDYSNWQYTVSSNYTNINEGNNKITSKILCLGGPQTLQAYYSVNITATNFTQAQLSTYTMMLESSNSTADGGNMSQVAGGLQPFAQIQQFNQDTGNGPICCKTTASSSAGSGSGSSSSSSSSSSSDDDDDSSSSSSSSDDDDDSGSRCEDGTHRSPSGDCEEVKEESDSSDNHYTSSSSRDDDDDDDFSSSSSSSSSRDDDDNNDGASLSDRLDNSDFGFNFDDSNDDSSGSSNSGVDGILDDVEDTMRSAGIDFSFS